MKLKTKHRVGKILFYVGNTIVAVLFIIPLLWMLMASLKPENEIFSNLASIKTFFPTGASLDNYKQVFQRIPMLRYIFNSFFSVAIAVGFDLLVNSLCGYALAKLNFKGRRLLQSLVMALMVLPIESLMIPLYLEVNRFGWLDTYAALSIPFIINCFSIYMFQQFFLDFPGELIEAASIDGCSQARTFFQVVLPNAGSVFVTVFILDFTERWNDFMWPLLVTVGDEHRTVQLAVQTFFGTKPIYYGPIMAALVISALPMIILFLCFQKYYVQGVVTTGIKG